MDSAGVVSVASEEQITVSTKQNVTVLGDFISSGVSGFAFLFSSGQPPQIYFYVEQLPADL